MGHRIFNKLIIYIIRKPESLKQGLLLNATKVLLWFIFAMPKLTWPNFDFAASIERVPN
jgi:hypothetical protein